jgi:hypothetical protein
MDPAARSDFLDDWRAAQAAVSAGVVSQRARSANTHWTVWSEFCTSLAIDPLLSDIEDPVILFQVFMHRYRSGAIAPRGRPVLARSVEDALRSVGQTFAQVGATDPRFTDQGRMDFRIQRQLASYKKKDPPPKRVKPVPVQVIHWIMTAARLGAQVENLAVADMIALAFFFLLRPGEYTATPSETTPFAFRDVALFHGMRRLNLSTATDAELLSATFSTLEFTTQKNGVRGEVIGLGRSGHTNLCPVLSLARRIIHLRQNDAPPTTPLATYFVAGTGKPVSPAAITATLRLAVTSLGPSLGFLPSDISARCLRAAGAMALLCAQVDTDIIRLLGRWRSDEMLRYLHVQAAPVMRDFASKMLSGHFTLHPNSQVPNY